MSSKASSKAVKKHNHTMYDHQVGSDNLEELMDKLAGRERLQKGDLYKWADEYGVNRDTMKTWRRKLKGNPSYRPQHNKPGKVNAKQSEMEERLKEKLSNDYLKQNRYCPPGCVSEIARREAEECGMDGFTAGQHWRDSFCERNKFSFRAAHVKRRTEPNDDIVASFCNSMMLAKEQFPPDLLLNTDETCWRVLNGKLRTLAPRGADHVAVQSAVDEKESITAIATITMSGEKLPLIILAKGTTRRCEDRFRQSPLVAKHLRRKALYIFHTESGWSTDEFAMEYLHHIKNTYLKDNSGGLLWDLHGSHRTQDVKDTAAELGIGLFFVPAGQTDHWQPLDNRVFGALKAAARASFDILMARKNLTEVSIMDAIDILVQCWENLDTEFIKNARKNTRNL